MKRRKSDLHEHESSERWLVSYADFITLMFAFFVVLYATSEQNTEKAKDFQDSVKKYLIKSAGGYGGSGDKVEQNERYNAVIEPPLKTFKVDSEDTAKLRRDLEDYLDSKLSSEERREFLMDLSSEGLGVRIVTSMSGLFEKDSLSLKPAAQNFLDHLAGLSKSLDRRLAVEAHVENRKYSRLDPLDFSALRGSAIVKALQKRNEASSISLIAQGAARPLKQGPGSAGLNERIEFIFLTEDL